VAATGGDAEGSPTSETEQAAAPCGGSTAAGEAGEAGEAATGATADDDAAATGAGAEGEFEAASGRRPGGLAGSSLWSSRSDSGEQTQSRRSWKTLPKMEAELEGSFTGLGGEVDPAGEGSQAELDLAGVGGCVDQGDLGGVDVDLEEIVVPALTGSGN
jgi:hypothetical protein